MRVLVAHNRYRSDQPSGENAAVAAEIARLERRGVEVIPFLKDSDSLRTLVDKARASTGPVWAPGSRELAQLIQRERPDVLHLHNVFPLISPWPIRTAKAKGVAVVQTVHNYRHQCVAGMHLRGGSVCEACGPQEFALPAVVHGCYRGSRAQSAAMAVGQAVHRATWRRVDTFFVLTAFMAHRLAATGIPADRIVVRPSSCEDPGTPVEPKERRVLFVGRLERAKGVLQLLAAWERATARDQGWKLVLAGSGPLESEVSRAAAADSSIQFVGHLSRTSLADEYRRAGFVAVPSLWFEGFPLVVSEALAHGRAVIAPALDNFASMLGQGGGLLVGHGPDAWAERLSTLDLDLAGRVGAEARRHFEARLATAVTDRQLLDVYSQLVHRGRGVQEVAAR